MNLTTQYLGLTLKNPLMPGASPLVDDLDTVRKLEDAGAGAIVMHSLFEEQIRMEEQAHAHHVAGHGDSFSEASSFLPSHSDFALTPDRYLEQLRRIKDAVDIPVIASLNGVSLGGWLDYAKFLEEAGADALEVNYYRLPCDPFDTAVDVESDAEEIVHAVCQGISIPVSVKLAPFFSALPNFACQLVDAGAKGLVLFNRFYQPDIDIENLEAVPSLQLSDSSELRLRLRWLAILHGQLDASLAVTGGVHTPVDVIKALMAGADAVQMVSALLKNGPGHLATVLKDVTHWLEEHEYTSLSQLRGSMSLRKCPDPTAFERTNYLRILQGWKV